MISPKKNGSTLNQSVLVLNTNYTPMDICTAKRAICLFYNEKVDILESYSEFIHLLAVFAHQANAGGCDPFILKIVGQPANSARAKRSHRY